VGNAFPPPLAEAVGRSIMAALRHEGEAAAMPELTDSLAHDDVYQVLKEAGDYLTSAAITRKLTGPYGEGQLERRLAHLSRDFVVDIRETRSGPAYRLGDFKGFIGQEDHDRHLAFTGPGRSRIS
jgi:DNA (cytosine-5)-methyltransferase 1